MIGPLLIFVAFPLIVISMHVHSIAQSLREIVKRQRNSEFF